MISFKNNTGRVIQSGEIIFCEMGNGQPLEVVEVDGRLVARPYDGLEELLLDRLIPKAT